MPLHPVLARALWLTMTALASVIALYALLLLCVPGSGPPFVAALRASLPWALAAHLGGSAAALALGPWQFSRRLRSRHLALHRWSGRAYVGAVLIGGTGALFLAPRSQEGPITHVGFGLLGVLWLGSTLAAYAHIRAGRPTAHRDWMTRSFALTLAAVMLRIYLPLGLAYGIPFRPAYQVISWVCWVPNLVVAEWMIRRRPMEPEAGVVG
jgi:uncharacterized membrane protein